MQAGEASRVAGPAAVITVVTVIMLGAMAFAVPPARIEVKETGHQRGYLVPHSQFSPGLALNVAADGYSYLAIDLTTADRDAHWSKHLDRVNEVQFPVWGWIELGSASEQEAIRLAQVATVEHATAKDQLQRYDAPNSVVKELARSTLVAVVKAQGKLKGKQAEDEVQKLLLEHHDNLVAAEQAASKHASRLRDAALRASADWKLKELVPGLNLQGFYIVGPGAVARAQQLARERPSWTVLPVVASDEGAHAVALSPDAFPAGAKEHDYPILVATGIGLEKIGKLREGVEGNYLVATIAVVR